MKYPTITQQRICHIAKPTRGPPKNSTVKKVLNIGILNDVIVTADKKHIIDPNPIDAEMYKNIEPIISTTINTLLAPFATFSFTEVLLFSLFRIVVSSLCIKNIIISMCITLW